MTEQQPLVSIVIPCYNHAQFVQESIQSVIDQDYENIELIIIDDGSKDNSVEVIQEMIPACEERFARFEFRYRPNKGLCATLNEALEWCEGEFFSPHASDDVSLPKKTSTQVELMLKLAPSVAALFTGVQAIDENGSAIYKFGYDGFINFENVFLRNVSLPGQAVILRVKALKAVGGYEPKDRIEDLGLFLRLTKNGYMLFGTSETLLSYRKHTMNTSSNATYMLESVLAILSNYKEDKLYSKALSRSYLIEVGTAISTNRFLAFMWLLKSIRYDFSVLLHKDFIKKCILLTFPDTVITCIRNIKKSTIRHSQI